MRTWTPEQEELLSLTYSDHTNNELSELFCGKTIDAIHKKARKLGLVQTDEVRFMNRSSAQKVPTELHKKSLTNKGYVQVYCPDHPRADSSGRVMEHILVFEQATGISVPLNCVIHHINGIRSDNRIENLCLMERGAHTTLHHVGINRTEATKSRISESSRSRLSDHTKHPCYKQIDIDSMLTDISEGKTIDSVCKKHGISKATYYRRLKWGRNSA